MRSLYIALMCDNEKLYAFRVTHKHSYKNQQDNKTIKLIYYIRNMPIEKYRLISNKFLLNIAQHAVQIWDKLRNKKKPNREKSRSGLIEKFIILRLRPANVGSLLQ